jgi:phage tail-like protein
MNEIELPSLVIDALALTVATGRPLLVNRDPGPGEAGVPLTSTIALELLDTTPVGVALSSVKVWIDGELAFEGSLSPGWSAAFGGPRAELTQEVESLRLQLDPLAPFASQATVIVRVVAATSDGQALDETYAFAAEDRTAPRLLAAVALGPRRIRLAFDEPITIVDAAGLTLRALAAPAVALTVVGAVATDTLVDLNVRPEMTPEVLHQVKVAGVTDARGNIILPPFDTASFAGWRPPRPASRRFDLWSMLPRHNRRSDATGDLARFIACLQEVVDLLLAEIDRFSDLFDLERAPPPFLDLLLRDLGNPFAFDLDTLGKRRLAAVLVEMYRQKGTAVGIRNAVRFFLGVDVEEITPLAGTALVLGESELDVDWELGPSDRFARYAFDVRISRALTLAERRQLRALVEYLKPAHTHFINLLEPVPPAIPAHWELGLSDIGDTSVLHG